MPAALIVWIIINIIFIVLLRYTRFGRWIYAVGGNPSAARYAGIRVDAVVMEAVRTLGEKEFASRFGKSEAHSCGAHAKCGGSAQILNWVPTKAGECKAQGGILIEETAGKKVAKKA